MNIQAKQRLQYFDALKAFTIFLVLCGHSIQYLLHSSPDDSTFFCLIYTFHMPLFMMMSGYFSFSAVKRGFWESIATRARMLLLPIATLSFILAALYLFLRSENLIYKFFYLFGGNLWFLKTAFTCFFLTRLCFLCGRYKYLAIIATLILSQMDIIYMYSFLYGFTNINIMYPCFLVGLLIRNHWNYFTTHCKQVLYISLAIFVVMLLFFSRNSSLSIINIFNIELKGVCSVFYSRFYELATGFSGSIFFISLFSILFNRKIENKIYDTICYWGQNTLGIYILQFVYLEILINGLIYFDNTNYFVFNFIIVPLVSLAVLILCIVTINIVRRNKYSTFLLLGEKL